MVRFARVLVVPTAALAIVLLIAPGRAELALHVYVLVLLALGLGAAVAAISASQPGGSSTFDEALHRPRPGVERLPELAKLERETALAQSNAFDLHYRLRPTVREIAAGLLAGRRGIDLDRQPALARTVLGDETWELVRPGRPAPPDRFGPGIDTRELDRVVTALEAL